MHRWYRFLLAFTATLVVAVPEYTFATGWGERNLSGIIDYKFAPKPQEITPKLHNWEIRLNKADSRRGTYQIVQITAPEKPARGESSTTIVVDSNIIVPDQDGIIDFQLHIGDAQPKENMGRRGDGGEPIIFSGIGTAKAESGWIVMPGEHIDEMSPAPKGTLLKKGKLDLIQIYLHNDHGDKFRADVFLRCK